MPKTQSIFDHYAAQRGNLVNYAASITGDRSTAEDVVQEAWIRIERAAPRSVLEEPVGYLYRIVRNLALDGLRRRRFERRHFVDGEDGAAHYVATETPTPESAVVSRDELRIVMDVLENLPERMRIAVEMHRFRRAKLKDIAAHLGVSVTVAHELVAEGVQRCRVRLRRSL